MPQAPLALADFTVTYQLRTLGAKTRVRIPLADAGINLRARRRAARRHGD